MKYIIGRWEAGEWPSRVYYTLDFTRWNNTTHVKSEALEFGTRESARVFLESGTIPQIHPGKWHLIKRGK